MQPIDLMTVSQTFFLPRSPESTLRRKGVWWRSDSGYSWAVFSILRLPVMKLILNLHNVWLLCLLLTWFWTGIGKGYNFLAPETPRPLWSLLAMSSLYHWINIILNSSWGITLYSFKVKILVHAKHWKYKKIWKTETHPHIPCMESTWNLPDKSQPWVYLKQVYSQSGNGTSTQSQHYTRPLLLASDTCIVPRRHLGCLVSWYNHLLRNKEQEKRTLLLAMQQWARPVTGCHVFIQPATRLRWLMNQPHQKTHTNVCPNVCGIREGLTKGTTKRFLCVVPTIQNVNSPSSSLYFRKFSFWIDALALLGR